MFLINEIEAKIIIMQFSIPSFTLLAASFISLFVSSSAALVIALKRGALRGSG